VKQDSHIVILAEQLNVAGRQVCRYYS